MKRKKAFFVAFNSLASHKLLKERSRKQAQQQERQTRLEAAYARLAAAGKPFSGRALAREAQVALSTAQHFLHTQRQHKE